MKKSLSAVALAGLSVLIACPAQARGREPVAFKTDFTEKDYVLEQVKLFNPAAMRRAIEDLVKTYGPKYPKGDEFLRRVADYERDLKAIVQEVSGGRLERGKALLAFKREAMLGNPLLDFDKILIIRRFVGDSCRTFKDPKVSRFGNGINLGLPWRNSHDNCTIADPKGGWENELAVMTDFRRKPRVKTLYKPDGRKIVIDLELDFDGRRIMFSSIGTGDRWHVFETDTHGRPPEQLTPKDTKAVDSFDSCYLPDGNVIFSCTAQFSGLPCEGGTAPTAMPFLLNRKTGKIRQLGFDQETSWNYSVMADGRVLYLRYEYTDLPHYFSRLLFTCNPDGTTQRAYYGSNSYWPNSFFGARRVPGHHTMVVGTATGHHGLSRMGRLVLLDPALGTHEVDGVVQAIPGWQKEFKNITTDCLHNRDPFKALTPWPLSGKYFLTMMKPYDDSLWGLYLVDIFDNVTLIHQEDKYFFIDPIPLKARRRPPVIPARVNLDKKTATVFLQDVYAGPGLKGIPRGTVKRLRVMAYNFSITHTGGHNRIGHESSWDVKRILGTVPVEADGSASFVIPANTPVAVQPLDEQGAALQLFRSWFTAMPGENVSCIGCHEESRAVPLRKRTAASDRAPSTITPWNGPPRPFGFENEVQPLLTKRCVGCHDGAKKDRPNFSMVKRGRSWSPSYMALQALVHRPGPESDLHLLTPMEFHASTSPLVQKLKGGHSGVKLGPPEWEALFTWIDLNVPYHGSIVEQSGVAGNWKGNKQPYVKMPSQSECLGVETSKGTETLLARRMELARLYGGPDVNPERDFMDWRKVVRARKITPVMPPEQPAARKAVSVRGWPFSADEARRKQASAGKALVPIDLGDRCKLEVVMLPAGELPVNGHAVKIERPFMMSVGEISNHQYRAFDPDHDSGYVDRPGKDQRSRGESSNRHDQPAIRVSYDDAVRYCEWLGKKIGRKVLLPTEAQWEWACRAGTATPMWFGECDADFSKVANLADAGAGQRMRGQFPVVEKFKDGATASAPITNYAANTWGLKNMHGNVAEWTRTSHDADGSTKVVRGGSWRDLPRRATSSHRIAYKTYQKVMNVGFRIVIAE